MNKHDCEGIFFSVVIPVYNKEPHIDRCINSVINQKYQNFEIIAVDDGSTDASFSSLIKYKSPRVKVFKKRNGGAASARNYGVQKSHGKYVAFLDADDAWSDEHLSTIVLLHRYASQAVAFGTGYQRVNRSNCGRKIRLARAGNFKVIKNYVRDFSKTMPLTHSSTTVVKKEILLAVGGFPCELTYYEDWAVWLKVAMCGDVAYSSKITATLYMDAVNRSDKNYRADIKAISINRLANILEEFSVTKGEPKLRHLMIIRSISVTHLKSCIARSEWKEIKKFRDGNISKYLSITQRFFYLTSANRVLRRGFYLKQMILKWFF